MSTPGRLPPGPFLHFDNLADIYNHLNNRPEPRPPADVETEDETNQTDLENVPDAQEESLQGDMEDWYEEPVDEMDDDIEPVEEDHETDLDSGPDMENFYEEPVDEMEGFYEEPVNELPEEFHDGMHSSHTGGDSHADEFVQALMDSAELTRWMMLGGVSGIRLRAIDSESEPTRQARHTPESIAQLYEPMQPPADQGEEEDGLTCHICFEPMTTNPNPGHPRPHPSTSTSTRTSTPSINPHSADAAALKEAGVDFTKLSSALSAANDPAGSSIAQSIYRIISPFLSLDHPNPISVSRGGRGSSNIEPERIPERAVTLKKCSHSFGRECLTTWLEQSRNPTCPICRTEPLERPRHRSRSESSAVSEETHSQRRVLLMDLVEPFSEFVSDGSDEDEDAQATNSRAGADLYSNRQRGAIIMNSTEPFNVFLGDGDGELGDL